MGVPSPLPSDVPEVVRALADAAAAWPSDIDATIMWIHRAAQIAGQAGDDERALSLALAATELKEKRTTSAVIPVARKHDESATTAEVEVGQFRQADIATKK